MTCRNGKRADNDIGVNKFDGVQANGGASTLNYGFIGTTSVGESLLHLFLRFIGRL